MPVTTVTIKANQKQEKHQENIFFLRNKSSRVFWYIFENVFAVAPL